MKLPFTSFPMRADLIKREASLINEYIYRYLSLKNFISNRIKKFIIADGPPYANGKIHIGHALNKNIKDIACRYHIMTGKDVEFIPGFDCHGLPIENKISTNNKDVKLIPACRKYANEQIINQIDQFKRLNIFADWSNFYKTMDYEFQEFILTSLLSVKPYLQRVFKPLYWCFACSSTLAESDVEYFDKTSIAIYVLFPTENKDINLLAWTTTPWTIFANQALAISNTNQYLIIEKNNKNLVVSEQSYTKLKNTILIDSKVIKTISIKDMPKQVINPEGNIVPVLHADFVSKEQGTGIVHIAPSYGDDDFKLAKEHNLNVKCNIDDLGFYTSGSGKGLNVNDIENILQILKDCIFYKEEYIHSYPHCWRHKEPIIIRSQKQLVLNIDKNKISENIFNTKWSKDVEKLVFKNTFDREHWCISRQRYWGVPIPKLINKQEIEKASKTIKYGGLEAYNDGSLDVLDVWYDSGCVIPYLTKDKKHKTVDLAVEGIDQTRGWFQSSIILSSYINNCSPFKHVVCHEFVVDENKRKMSKSLGNIIDPLDIINEYGSDILRLVLARSNFKRPVVVSKDVIQDTIAYYRKIRNVIRYLLGDYKLDSYVNDNTINYFDKWILSVAVNNHNLIVKDYENYDFQLVCKKINNFVHLVSNYYISLTKDRFYMSLHNTIEYKSLRYTYNNLLFMITKWIAPILPFTSEECWRHMGFKDILLHPIKHQININLYSKDDLNQWNQIFDVLALVNSKPSGPRIVDIFHTNKQIFRHIKKEHIELFFSAVQVNIFDGEKIQVNVKNNPDYIKCKSCYRYVFNQILCKACKNTNMGLSRDTI